MPVRTLINHEDGLTEHIATGDVIDDEMFEAQREFYEEGPTRFQLWDMTGCSLEGITIGGMRRFIEKAARLGQVRKDGKTAVVVGSQLQYGLARMAETFAEFASLPFAFHVFRSIEEARAWLDGRLEGGRDEKDPALRID